MMGLAATFFALLAIFGVSLAYDCEEVPGNRLSPINIDNGAVKKTKARKLSWSYDYFKAESYELTDIGTTLELRKSNDSKALLYVEGGNLEVRYTFQNVHFHWGTSDGKGSEHRVDDHAFPIEMHVVHTQDLNSTLDRYLVVAAFFEITYIPNWGLSTILPAAIYATRNKNQSVPLDHLILAMLVPTGDFSYYTYPGSLTTPPYTESVTWIIQKNPEVISRSQMEVFRKAAKIDPGLADNFRCIQKLNNRVVRLVSARRSYFFL